MSFDLATLVQDVQQFEANKTVNFERLAPKDKKARQEFLATAQRVKIEPGYIFTLSRKQQTKLAKNMGITLGTQRTATETDKPKRKVTAWRSVCGRVDAIIVLCVRLGGTGHLITVGYDNIRQAIRDADTAVNTVVWAKDKKGQYTRKPAHNARVWCNEEVDGEKMGTIYVADTSKPFAELPKVKPMQRDNCPAVSIAQHRNPKPVDMSNVACTDKVLSCVRNGFRMSLVAANRYDAQFVPVKGRPKAPETKSIEVGQPAYTDSKPSDTREPFGSIVDGCPDRQWSYSPRSVRLVSLSR